MSKIKGTNAERELLKLFWSKKWACIRSAGSGSMHFPCPDLLAANKVRKLALEVKSTKEDKKYFSKEEVQQLLTFSSYFGAEPWIAIKFRTNWLFVNPEDLTETKTGFVFRSDSHRGLSFKELI